MKLIFRMLYGLYRIYSWIRRRLSRRFTAMGLGVLGALAVCVVLVPDTENNFSYQLLPVLFVLLLLPWCFCFFFKGRFDAERRLPKVATAGSPLSYRVRIKNLTSKNQSGLTLLEDLADARPSFDEWLAVQVADERRFRAFRIGQGRRDNPFKIAAVKEVTLPPVSSGQESEAEVQLLPFRRGVLNFSGLTLARPDPLGLMRSFIRVPLSESLLILPKRYPLPPLALPGSMKYQQGGVALAASVGQSEEFVSLRDYQEGDPLRHIHWRSWARTGKPVVKEFEDEFFVRHALVLDTFTDEPHGETFEEAVAVAASFACSVRQQDSLLDLLFVGPESYCFTVGRSLGSPEQMLRILAAVRTCTNQPFSALEHLVMNHVQLVSGCVCVLLAWDEARLEFIRKLQALDVPVLVLVVVEAGSGAKLKAGPMASDPNHFHVLEVGRVKEGLARLS